MVGFYINIAFLCFLGLFFVPNMICAEVAEENSRLNLTVSSKGAKCPPSKNVAKGLCPETEHQQIINILGEKAAECYSRLFVAESKTKTTVCSPGTYHRADNPGNTGVGFGICALDKDPGKRSLRGKNCTASDIYTSFARQVLCCRDIVEKTPRYFGTMNCGHVPNCRGLSAYGSGLGSAISSGTSITEVCRINDKLTLSDGTNCKGKKVAFMGCLPKKGEMRMSPHSGCAADERKIFMCKKRNSKKYKSCRP